MKLVMFPHPALRQKAKRVIVLDDGVKQIVRNMIKIMYASKGIGLAAPQVALSKRIIVVSDPETGKAFGLINPEILSKEGSQTGLEGCLSFPGLYKEVTRYDTISVKFMHITGRPLQLTVSGLLSRCIQHECDHLNGVVFTDYENGNAVD